MNTVLIAISILCGSFGLLGLRQRLALSRVRRIVEKYREYIQPDSEEGKRLSANERWQLALMFIEMIKELTEATK